MCMACEYTVGSKPFAPRFLVRLLCENTFKLSLCFGNWSDQQILVEFAHTCATEPTFSTVCEYCEQCVLRRAIVGGSLHTLYTTFLPYGCRWGLLKDFSFERFGCSGVNKFKYANFRARSQLWTDMGSELVEAQRYFDDKTMLGSKMSRLLCK